jgi:hypothetical protein
MKDPFVEREKGRMMKVLSVAGVAVRTSRRLLAIALLAFMLVAGGIAYTGGTAHADTGTSSRTTATGVTLGGCSNTWRWGEAKTGIDSPLVYINVSGSGYGDHCGNADFPNNPSMMVQCICSSWSQSSGHYDSNYAQSHFGDDKAALWANITVNLWLGTDTYMCRVWIDPNANISSKCY